MQQMWADGHPPFGTWLRQRRRALRLTQAALAQPAGCSPDVVRDLESGAKLPSRALAERLADALRLGVKERAAFVRAASVPDDSSRRPRPDQPTSTASQELPVPVAPPMLPRTKFFPPRLRPDMVIRLRLLRTVQRALHSARLVLVSAPAGSGKTTLLASAAEGAEQPLLAWLSLDEDDNDLVRFLHALVAALRPHLAELSAEHVLVDRPGAAGWDLAAMGRHVVGALINDVLALNNRIVLVLDDLHVVTNSAIYATLDYLLERLPAHVTVAIGTRHDPPLALTRLRVRRESIEVRLPDLRFTEDEAAELLTAHLDLSLTPSEIATLCQRTEGWAAGLGLLAASLERMDQDDRGRFLEHFAHTDRYVLDYLADEVLNRQEPPVRAFLLETAVLPDLTPRMCQWVTGRRDAAALLDDLYRRNLFLNASQPAAGEAIYHYHDLFAGFLRERLRREAPERLHELHRRAAAAETLPARRVHHYLQAELWDEAAEVIEQVGEQMIEQGMLASLLHWIAAVPDHICERRPRLVYLRGVCAYTAWELDSARRFLDSAYAGFTALGDTVGQGETLSYLAGCLSMMGEFPAAQAATERALACSLQPHQRVQLLCGRAWLALPHGNWEQANTDLDAALDLTAAAADVRSLHALAVNLHSPLVVLSGGIARVEQFGRLVAAFGADNRFLQASHEALFAWACVWRNQWDAARRAGEHVLKECAEMPNALGIVAEVGLVLPTCAALQGRNDEAEAGFQLMFHALAQPRAAQWARTWKVAFLYCHGRALWLQGQLIQAEDVYAEMCAITHPREWPFAPSLRAMLHALLLLSRRRYDQAEQRLREAVIIQDRLRFPVLWDDARLLLAYTCLLSGREDDALTILAPALEEHAVEGTPGRIRWLGAAVSVPLLRLAIQHEVHAAFARDVLAAIDEAAPDPQAAMPIRTAVNAFETLSAREVEVLRLMANGASNKAIANELVISPHTVKIHVAKILAKLAVRSRIEAANRAREMDLI